MKVWKSLVVCIVAIICACVLYYCTKHVMFLFNVGFFLAIFVFILYKWIELSLKIHDFDW